MCSVNDKPYVLVLAEDVLMVAASNPMAYYRVVEQCCRLIITKDKRGSSARVETATITCCLLIPGILSGDAHTKLLPSWDHSKAYMSAIASCVKGMIWAAQQQQQQQKVGCVERSDQQGSSGMREHGGQEQEQVAEGMFKSFPYMLTWLAEEANSMTADPKEEPLYEFIRRTRPLEAKHLFTPRGIQLVALLWLARGVNAAGWLLLPWKNTRLVAAAGGSSDPRCGSQLSSSSSSRNNTSHLDLGSSSSSGKRRDSSVTTSSGVNCSRASSSSSSSSNRGTHDRPRMTTVEGIMHTAMTLTRCTEQVHLAAYEGEAAGEGGGGTEGGRGREGEGGARRGRDGGREGEGGARRGGSGRGRRRGRDGGRDGEGGGRRGRSSSKHTSFTRCSIQQQQ